MVVKNQLVGADSLADIDRVRLAMAEAGIDALVASSRRNVLYLANFPGFDYLIEPEATSFVVLPRRAESEPELITSMSERLLPLYVPSWVHRVRCFGSYHIVGAPPYEGRPYQSAHDALAASLTELGVEAGQVAFELDLLPVRDLEAITSRLPGLAVADASRLLGRLRRVKTPVEVSRVRRAVEITERAIEAGFEQLHEGMTGLELGQRISAAVVGEGAEVVYCQVGFNGHGSMGVAYPTEQKLHDGDLVRVDVSASYLGYHSDIGRNCVFGSATSELRRLYDVTYGALQAGIDAAVPGATAGQVFEAALDVPRRTGLTDFRRHHVGHGIGLQAHEAPLLKPGATDVIEPGMVLAIEAPYYLYGVAAFSPEDIGVV
ncbi:MAG: hypothetical protein QOF11_1078, partial [Chloroflexota bacterium]|nr:hypothetical protein [Chloroflexota bacterium]